MLERALTLRHDLHHFRRRIGDVKQSHIVIRDLSLWQHHIANPVQQSTPISCSKQHDRKVANLLRLNQGERFKEFVKRAEAAGKNDEAQTVFHEHHLAHKEVFERQAVRLIRIGLLFERQFDVAADREAACFERAAVGGLHDARAAAGDHGETLACAATPQFPARPCSRDRPGLRARGTKDRDAARERGQFIKAFDKLAHDAEHAPGVSMRKLVRPRALEQLLVLSGARFVYVVRRP